MDYIIRKPEEYLELARIIQEAGYGIVLLKGDLGTGKTTFAKAFALNLGEESMVTSPTYSIIKEYPKVDLVHMDLYRITDPEELFTIGFDDYLEKRWVIIEWPEIAEAYLPKDAVILSFEYLDEETRKVRLT